MIFNITFWYQPLDDRNLKVEETSAAHPISGISKHDYVSTFRLNILGDGTFV